MAKQIDDLEMKLKAEQEKNNTDLSTRQEVEYEDAEVQFSYLQPISGTITLYYCKRM